MSEPLAYRTGSANFYGYDFTVNQHTLIPRPETEQLVEKTVELAQRYLTDRPRILDVGTGSGIIAITLKKLLPDSVVEATDISPKALEIATQNAKAHNVDVTFHESNLLDAVSDQFDLIIANLPYVPAARWRFLESQVRDFEPRSAIIAGKDGLRLISRLCQEIKPHLRQSGLVALEIDDNHGPRVLNLLQAALPDHVCTIERDLAHRVRFAFAVPK